MNSVTVVIDETRYQKTPEPMELIDCLQRHVCGENNIFKHYVLSTEPVLIQP